MKNDDRLLPTSYLTAITLWIAALINTQRVDDQKATPVTEVQVARTLVLTVGEGMTFGIFSSINGAQFFEALRDIASQVRVPRNIYDVLSAFARTWSEGTPTCNACGAAGIVANRNRNGVEVLQEGSVCPFCKKGSVVVKVVQTTHINWVTLREVPLDVEFDTTSEVGAEIPLTEEGLRARTSNDTLVLLSKHDVEVWQWAAWLLQVGAPSFGGTKAPMAVLRMLRWKLVEEHEMSFIAAKILAAKHYFARGVTATAVTTSHVGDTPRFRPLPHDQLLKLADACIRLGIVREPLSGVDPRYVASLAHVSSPGGQVISDLASMNSTGNLSSGDAPLQQWIRSALTVYGTRREAVILIAALEATRM